MGCNTTFKGLRTIAKREDVVTIWLMTHGMDLASAGNRAAPAKVSSNPEVLQ